jgi:AcrR family transcriptional regulator
MDDVSRHMCLSKKTLYQYVSNKNDLVEKAVELMAAQNAFNCEEDMQSFNAIEKHVRHYEKITTFLSELNPSFEYDLQKYYQKQWYKLMETRRSVLFEKMKSDIIQGIEEGFFRNNFDVEKVVLFNLIRIEGLKETDVLPQFNYKLIDVVQEFFNYHIYAISTPKGIEEYHKLMEKHKLK